MTSAKRHWRTIERTVPMEGMTCKQRAMACIEGRKPDRVPVHHLQFSGHAARVILGRDCLVGGAHVQWRAIQALWDDPQGYPAFLARCEQDAVAIARACGHDILRLHYWGWSGGRPTKKIDDYSFLFGETDGQWHVLTYHPELELLTRRDGYGSRHLGSAGMVRSSEPDERELAREVEEAEAAADACQTAPGADKKLQALYERYPDDLLKLGTDTVYVDMDSTHDLLAIAMYPDLVARLHMAKARRLCKDIPRLAAAGMQVNFCGWDFCSKDGPVISPAAFDRVLTPALKLLWTRPTLAA